MQGGVGQALFQVFAHRDVLRDGHQVLGPALGVGDDAECLAHPQHRAVFAPVGLFDFGREGGGPVVQSLGQKLLRFGLVLGVAQLQHVQGAQLVQGVAQHVAELVVGAHDAPVGGNVRNAHGRLAEGGPKQGFAGVQGLGGGALACEHQHQQPGNGQQGRRGRARYPEIGRAPLFHQGHVGGVGGAHRDHQRVARHAAVADGARHLVDGLAAVHKSAFVGGGVALEPGQLGRIQPEAVAVAHGAAAHHAVQAGQLQQALGPEVGLAVKIREMLRVDRQHYHPRKAAIGPGDAQRHRNLPGARHPPEHGGAHIERIFGVLPL